MRPRSPTPEQLLNPLIKKKPRRKGRSWFARLWRRGLTGGDMSANMRERLREITEHELMEAKKNFLGRARAELAERGEEWDAERVELEAVQVFSHALLMHVSGCILCLTEEEAVDEEDPEVGRFEKDVEDREKLFRMEGGGLG